MVYILASPVRLWPIFRKPKSDNLHLKGNKLDESDVPLWGHRKTWCTAFALAIASHMSSSCPVLPLVTFSGKSLWTPSRTGGMSLSSTNFESIHHVATISTNSVGFIPLCPLNGLCAPALAFIQEIQGFTLEYASVQLLNPIAVMQTTLIDSSLNFAFALVSHFSPVRSMVSSSFSYTQ